MMIWDNVPQKTEKSNEAHGRNQRKGIFGRTETDGISIGSSSGENAVRVFKPPDHSAAIICVRRDAGRIHGRDADWVHDDAAAAGAAEASGGKPVWYTRSARVSCRSPVSQACRQLP